MSGTIKKIINLNTASSLLEVSPATLRNWVKAGLVPAQKAAGAVSFSENEILKVKKKIQKGEIQRLRKRANKNQDDRKHSHSELLESKENEELLLKLLQESKASAKEFLHALYLSALMDRNLVRVEQGVLLSKKKNIHAELEAWGVDISQNRYLRTLQLINASELDFSDNVLGFAYQTLSRVGSKQKSGAYYTPPSLSTRMLKETITRDGLFLDPCCGGGNFVVAAYKRLLDLKVDKPYGKVFGQDLDLTAVLVARGYLTLVTDGEADSVHQIVQGDALKEVFKEASFDYICTNPPWGADFKASYEKEIKKLYPQILSGESYSYFILSSLKKLNPQGILDFVLPESFLNVKMHQDIRHFILMNYKLLSVQTVKEKFSGVFTKAITLTVQNEAPSSGDVIFLDRSQKARAEILQDKECLLPLWHSDSTADFLAVLEKGDRLFLKDKSDWALGIVTGDNEKYLKSSRQKGCEGVLKGTDIFRFRTALPSAFLHFDRDRFQQVAPEEKYRASGKLIYRFICKELVFAVDREQTLTLNSANILIPQLPEYSLEALCGILNSKVMQLYYQKKFNSIKTLRGNLERLPFPVVKDRDLKKIEELSLRLEKGYDKKVMAQLDEAVMDLYEVPESLRQSVRDLELSASFV